MTSRPGRPVTARVAAALALVGTPRLGNGTWPDRTWTAYAAAKHCGCSLSAIYRAVERKRLASLTQEVAQ